MKNRNDLSIISRGARFQFKVAIILISILPLISIWYLASTGVLIDRSGGWLIRIVGPIILLMIVLGYLLLAKYPVTIVKLRKYLENIIKGELPDKVNLLRSENDISAIEDSMNIIIRKLKSEITLIQTEKVSLQQQLYQAQKLKTIGMLATGIAHEINTPIQFVGDNTRFLSDTVNDLLSLINTYRDLLSGIKRQDEPAILKKAQNAEQNIDLQFLENEIPKAISQTREGLSRVTNIVRAMKDFLYMGSPNEKIEADLNKAIESTSMVSRNEWKYVADLKLDLDPGLPPVPCYPDEIKQVLLNLITNAADAISSVVDDGSRGKGSITIASRVNDGSVEISVSDTGSGIPDDIRGKIFEPFFTTKQQGKGIGQGLAISREIVKKHNGKLIFDTETGRGTTFKIILPLAK